MGWKGLSSAFIFFCYSGLSFAESSGWEWFERSQSAVRQYNFEASFRFTAYLKSQSPFNIWIRLLVLSPFKASSTEAYE